MKKYLLNAVRALAIAVIAFAGLAPNARAQVVTQLPSFVAPNAVLDIGNGPTEIRMLTGSMGIFTSQSAGVGSTSGSSTALTLTATPTTPPCVGCILSANGITSGTTVISFNGTTTVGMSAAMTVPAASAVAWGAACPASSGSIPTVLVQASVGADIPLYTQARACVAGVKGPGGQFLQFTIGAH